jgi:hypothetical protein
LPTLSPDTEKSTCSGYYWPARIGFRHVRRENAMAVDVSGPQLFLLSLSFFCARSRTLGPELCHLEIAAKSFSQHTCIRSKAHAAAEIQRPLVGRNIKIMCKVEFLWPPFLRLLRPAESGHRRRFPFWSLCSACLLLCPPQRSCVLYF